MSKREHNAAASSLPWWVRCAALFCLLVVGVASTAEAVHIHGEWLPHHDAQLHQPADASQTLGGEEHCPLCVAMHAAVPVSVQRAPAPSLLERTAVVERDLPAPETRWHFAMFSRPPPAPAVA